ncbi:hypothetical protein HNR03_001814 [Pseudomonas sp. JAI111]|nr:hypothetical protein [Pseudomonas sp. JAI111]
MVSLLQRLPFANAGVPAQPKGSKGLCPGVRPLAGARCSFAPAFIWGHRLRSASRRPPLDVCDFAARRYASAPQINASTQPPEGAGRSRSKAAGELPLGLLSGEERGYTSIYCGSWPAGDGGLPANQSPAGVHRTLWELACRRWRPDSRPISCRCTPNPVGAGLPAKTACQPTNLLQVYSEPCGSELARDGGLPANPVSSDVFPIQIQPKKKPPFGGSINSSDQS